MTQKWRRKQLECGQNGVYKNTENQDNIELIEETNTQDITGQDQGRN